MENKCTHEFAADLPLFLLAAFADAGMFQMECAKCGKTCSQGDILKQLEEGIEHE